MLDQQPIYCVHEASDSSRRPAGDGGEQPTHGADEVANGPGALDAHRSDRDVDLHGLTEGVQRERGWVNRDDVALPVARVDDTDASRELLSHDVAAEQAPGKLGDT